MIFRAGWTVTLLNSALQKEADSLLGNFVIKQSKRPILKKQPRDHAFRRGSRVAAFLKAMKSMRDRVTAVLQLHGLLMRRVAPCLSQKQSRGSPERTDEG